MDEIKRCPFCDGEPTIDKEHLVGHWIYQVRCSRCFGAGPTWNVKKKAIDAWNQRVKEEV